MKEPAITKDKYEEIMQELVRIETIEYKERKDKQQRRAKNKLARKQRKVNKR